MDAIEFLRHDHRMVEQLFGHYEAATSESQRRGVIDIVVRELSKHVALEELIVYPLAKDILPEWKQAVDERMKSHTRARYTLVALNRVVSEETMSRDAADHLMAEMREQIEQHVRDDESELLPRLSQTLDKDALDEFGHVLEQGKHFAPTRPHLNAPDEPAALALASPVAAAFDRLRDRLEAGPRT